MEALLQGKRSVKRPMRFREEPIPSKAAPTQETDEEIKRLKTLTDLQSKQLQLAKELNKVTQQRTVTQGFSLIPPPKVSPSNKNQTNYVASPAILPSSGPASTTKPTSGVTASTTKSGSTPSTTTFGSTSSTATSGFTSSTATSGSTSSTAISDSASSTATSGSASSTATSSSASSTPKSATGSGAMACGTISTSAPISLGSMSGPKTSGKASIKADSSLPDVTLNEELYRPKLKSPVWNFFKRSKNPERANMVHCTVCKVWLMAHRSTSSMWSHIERLHKKPIVKPAPKIEFSSASRQLAEKRRAVIVHLVEDLRPFNTVARPGFQTMLSAFDPSFRIPVPKTLQNQCRQTLLPQMKAYLRSSLSAQPWIALTTDSWTSRIQDSFLSVTAHFVSGDDWKLKSVVLALVPCFESHTAQHTAQLIRDVLNEYAILERVSAITTDNASTMGAMKRFLPGEDTRCIAHTLQLTVNEVFNSCRQQLAAFRTIVQRFGNPEFRGLARAEMLRLLLPTLVPCIDCETRWGSTYQMLVSLLRTKPALSTAIGMWNLSRAKDDQLPILSDSDWIVAEAIIHILRPFYEITRACSGETYPTLSFVYPMISRLMAYLRDFSSSNPVISSMRDTLLISLESRWSAVSRSTLMACFLDPRFKNSSFFSQDAAAAAIFEEQVDDVSPESIAPATSSPSDFELFPEDNHSTIVVQPLQEEVALYVLEAVLNKDSQPLTWWQSRAAKYPLLSSIALKYLAIPATSVPSERLFSAAGSIVSPRRTNLDSDHVSMLVFMHANVRILKQIDLSHFLTAFQDHKKDEDIKEAQDLAAQSEGMDQVQE